MFKTFKYDLPSGVVVFLVALPLCLGISLASGAPFFSGIISGIIGGIVIGFLSGSKLSVSGPAAGLAALVLSSIHNIGSFPLFLCAVVLAGMLQVGMGLIKLGGIAGFFPSSVIKGLLTSIGILIIAKQLPHALGLDYNTPGSLFEILDVTHNLGNWMSHINAGPLLICIISIYVMLMWEKPFIKKRMKFIPGALVAVVFSILINGIFKMSGESLAINDSYLVQVKSASSVSEFLGFFTFPDFSGFTNSKVIVAGIMIAIIASLETLLSIEAVDNIDPDRNVTNTNRELIAQGVGNSIAGLIGGLPVTSVIVRSSANINSGAKSKLSAIFHGFLLLFCIILIPSVLNLIPLASLAAILLITGYKLCKPAVFIQMFKNGRYQFVPFIVTLLTILALDLVVVYPPLKGEGLLIGVITGLISAFISILMGNMKNSYRFNKESHHEGDIITIHLSEEVSFLNKANIRQTLNDIPEKSTVIIDASATKYIDFDVLELIKEFRDIKAPHKKIKCSTINFKEIYKMDDTGFIQSSH
jgi:MFS superfamily sulfate permease-like transporter